jgi:xanthine/uracil permease
MNNSNDAIRDARKLGIPKMLILGIQHMFAMFGATILVPILVNGYFSEACGEPITKGLTVAVTLFCAGFGTLFYSMGGGLLAFLVAVAVKKILPEKQIWIAGILAALAHSVGQLLVAALIGGTPYILFYMPVMLVCSLFTGLFTGLCAQILVLRGKKLWKIILT